VSNGLSLTDLARLADVTPRTVRYYMSQGLLSAPDAAGPATRYGEGHLARLRLIKRLQREHLPLAEIRSRLERLGDSEVEALLDAATPHAHPLMTPKATLAYVRELMTKTGVAPRSFDHPGGHSPGQPASLVRDDAEKFPVRDASGPSSAAPALMASPPQQTPVPSSSPSMLQPQAIDRSTWERVSINPDIEIHVRRPLDRNSIKQVERLLRIARDLFQNKS